jgi:hypothetical protein
LNSSVLERVDSITDLGVVLDSKMTFRNHIDATVAKGLAMLGFIKRLSGEFRDPYTVKALFVSLVRSKLEYACCVWQPFYAVHINRIERIQEKFVKYALRRLPWNTTRDLPSYADRCMLLELDTLSKRREMARVLLVFDVISGRIVSSRLLSGVGLRVLSYNTRQHDFFQTSSHRTNYGTFEPINAALHSFNRVASHFDFDISRSQFVDRIRQRN